jgi:cation transport regulator ChaB
MATLPDAIKVLPQAAQKIWLSVFNDNVSDQGDESATKIAWTAVKNKWKKDEDTGKWVEKGVVLFEDDDLVIFDVDKDGDLFVPGAAGKRADSQEKSEDLEEGIRQIRDAFYQQFRRPTKEPAFADDMWVQRVLDDALIVQGPDGLYRYPYTVTDDEITFGEPVKVEIDYKEVVKEVRFLKADGEKRLVYGVVMEPNEIDSQGDMTSADEIEVACHEFMVQKQALDLNHEREIEKGEAAIVENYIAPQNLSFDQGTALAGSWIMVTKVFADDMWQAIKEGELTGYSIKGRGVRTRRPEGG